MQLIVGSTALSYHTNCRIPSDIDIWTDESFTKAKGYDYKSIPSNILELVDYTAVDNINIATLDSLYTIKCSHLGWSNPNWNKHKLDLLHLKHLGCTLHLELYTALLTYWKQQFGNKDFLSLNKCKQDFFTDNVVYTYDHDWLHEQVAYPGKPMYTHCLKDGADILIDRDKFNLMSFEQQLQMFREEITVIAIERWLVNPKYKKQCSWVQAYSKALEKTTTTLTKGWATEFIAMNMEYFVKPEYKYFKYALEATKEQL